MRKLRSLLAIVLLMGLFVSTLQAEGTSGIPIEINHDYRFIFSNYKQKAGVEMAGDAKDDLFEAEVELYSVKTSTSDKNLMSGSFGVQFPKSIGAATFVPTKEIEIIERGAENSKTTEISTDTYHFFSWELTEAGKTEYDKERTVRESTSIAGPGGDIVKVGALIGNYIHLGTYTFNIGNKLPAGNAIVELPWLTTEIAQTPEYTEGVGKRCLNDEIWGDTSGDGASAYQAFKLGPDVNHPGVVQVDVPFKKFLPASWKSAIDVTSQDPKKPLTAKLYDETEPTTLVVTRTEVAAAAGAGECMQELDLSYKNDTEKLTTGHTYTLVLTKPGHLSYTLTGLVAKSENFSDIDVPAKIKLACGDINANGAGDGRVTLADRSVLMAMLNGSVAAEFPVVTGSQTYYNDLNGDGKITLADLNILMGNYNKSAATIAQKAT